MIETNPAARHRWPLWLKGLLGCVVAVLAAGGYGLWYHLLRTEPPAVYASDEDNFKYGTLGLGPGFPYYLWKVLPEVFADKLPGGWESLGLVVEPGHDLPVGFSKQTAGFPGLLPTCALCHLGSYRSSPGAPRVFVAGAPAARFDFDAFNNFVFGCVNDPRFTSQNLLAHIEKTTRLGWFERLVYRFVIIPATRAKVLDEQRISAWQKTRPTAGRGRTDAFNHFKIDVLGLPDDGSIGTSDYPPLWNQDRRPGLWLHWNGSGNNLPQENLLSVLPVIGEARYFQPATFKRLTNYLWSLRPPAFSAKVAPDQVTQGRAVFDRACASCHAFEAERTGSVIPVGEIGTDPAFLRMWTPAFVDKLRSVRSPPFRFDHLRISDGYVSPPLDGVWLRAPYLHNGSVPTLWDLLQPPQRRPVTFYRGSDLVDPGHLGFAAQGADAERDGSLYDTRLPGNGNGGHVYGVDLPDADKRALIEFLKTF